MESDSGGTDDYVIVREERWRRAIARRHGAASDFATRVYESFDKIRRDPHGRRTPRIIAMKRAWKGKYRYKHGRCRIVYRIDDERRCVELIIIEPRDEKTYRR